MAQWYSIQLEIRLVGCMVRASARQNLDGDFNDAMVRNRRSTSLISGRMEY